MVAPTTSTILRRRDAFVATYDTCGYAPTRAALTLLALAFEGRLLDDDRIWDHVEFWTATSGDELLEIEDWRKINAPTWSTTESIVIRAAADLADYEGAIDRPARIGDLQRLNASNLDAVVTALHEARGDRPDPATRSLIVRAFDQHLAVAAAVAR